MYLFATGLKQIIPVGWFLYCLMVLYLSMYIAVRWNLNKYACTFMGGLLFSVFYPLDTCSFLAFVLGLYVGEKGYYCRKNKDAIVLPALLIVFIGVMAQYFYNSFIVNTPVSLLGLQLSIITFPLLMVWKPIVQFFEKTRVLKWLGEQSMGLYLLHYMVLTVVFTYKEVLGIWYSLTIYIIVTLVVSFVFNSLTGKLVNKTKILLA